MTNATASTLRLTASEALAQAEASTTTAARRCCLETAEAALVQLAEAGRVDRELEAQAGALWARGLGAQYITFRSLA